MKTLYLRESGVISSDNTFAETVVRGDAPCIQLDIDGDDGERLIATAVYTQYAFAENQEATPERRYGLVVGPVEVDGELRFYVSAEGNPPVGATLALNGSDADLYHGTLTKTRTRR